MNTLTGSHPSLLRQSHATKDLSETITDRRSTRLFLRNQPVPLHLVEESLTLAMRAPSNSNIQPWQVFASGSARDRLVDALLESTKGAIPANPPLPEPFAARRSALGAAVYGSQGISRHDTDARHLAKKRNWEFFRAPLVGTVCVHRDLDYVDSMGVGMFLQTLLLALTARGLGTCVLGSIAQYPNTVRSQLAIPEHMRILCGLAIGYPDPDFTGNELRVDRNPVSEHITFTET